MSANNQDGSFEADHYALFDALPWAARELLRMADHSYKAGWVHANLRAYGRQRGLRKVQAILRAERLATIRRFYGVTHPQWAAQ